ncbi:MAG: ATP-dependent zinc metalloprotease FtsH [Deltaproteobacteria bacterium]|nr:ATP-dependent zinc metalloprotease FtsH [Deltaproteobacteria bacterium]
MKSLSRATVFWFMVILAALGLVLVTSSSDPQREEIAFPVFIAKVHDGLVSDITIKGQNLTGTLRDGTEFITVGPLEMQPVYLDLVESGITPSFEELDDESMWSNLLFSMLPIAVMVVLFIWFMRNIQGANGRAMNFGKSRATLQNESARRVTFEDVAGIEESKEELQEIIEFLKDPRKFTRLGGRIPKGVLLMGSPGTGKTLLARAVAGEAGVAFFSISGSDFVEMFVGVGASRVRDLFEQGAKSAPCIIFIDEIDAVGRQRGAGLGGGHDEREQTLNQLLVEMDGFDSTDAVILMAATNRPDVLDPALLRPGRFDRRVVVPNPDVKGREKILEIHTRKIPLDDDVDLASIAKLTPGFSGADLENLCNEAALLAAREDRDNVNRQSLEKAREKIFMGPERRSMVLPESERKTTAYHEAGHAIVAHLLPGHDPVHKVTIVPRGRALGLTMTMPDEDRLSVSKQELHKRIAMIMGGRAAEEVVFATVTGGAANDIQQATKIANAMVCELGMSDALGPVTWGGGQDEVFLGRQMTQRANYSEATARRIDEEVGAIVRHGHQLALRILRENIHVLHRVALTLVEQETLNREQFAALVAEAGPVPPGDIQWLDG